MRNLLFCLFACAPLAAQLDLPRSSPSSRPAPSAASPAGATAPGAPQPAGSELATQLQRGLRASGEPGSGAARENPLEIPAGTAGAVDAPRALPMAAAEQWLGALRAELAGAAPTDAARLERAAGRLLLAGEDGLAAARLALGEDDGVLLLTGARALLASGRADARAAVAVRMSGKLPAASALPLFDLLGALAPELLSDAQLVEWLAHPVGGVRSASEKALTRRAGPALVPVLRDGLGASRSEARTRAAVLLERIGGADALRALSGALGDASTEVAQRVANALADAAGAAGAAERRALLERLREGRGLDRAQCYAVLALVLSEERAGAAHFEARDAALFAPELRSAAPLSRVCAALVLAGLGWRWESAEPSDWLDHEVPQTLVRELSGSEFHADIAALVWPAQRRLQRISGENHGTDGPAWARWWMEAAPQFRARRTVLALPDQRAGELVLRYRSLGEGLVFELCGPDAPAPSAGALRLTREQCEHLRARALELGLADARCEPGQRPVGSGFARILELELAGARKTFGFGQDEAEPWFEEACALAREAADAQAWQRLRDARAHASQAEFLSAEAEWWAREAEPARRARRRVELALAAWIGGDEPARLAARAELEAYAEQPGLAQPGDFETWTQRIASAALEPGEVAFALAGARAAAGAALGTAQARALVEALLAGQPGQAQAQLPALVAEGGPELVLTLAADSRAAARAASAAALARLEHPDALEALRRLTLDRDEAVAAAALQAIGAQRVTLLRGEVRTRCMTEQEPSSLVRAAALRALGGLGIPPDGTLEEPGSLALFLRAFGDADPRIEEGAADGLAAYGDPAAAPVLMSLLSRPEGSALERAGRSGLERLGVAAWADLLRIAKSSTHPLRRTALLILARQGCAQACRYLLEYYTDHAADSEIAYELCVLSGRDLRAELDPVQAWWDWSDAAPRDDGRAWWIDGAARAGYAAPPEGALDAPVGAAGRAWIEQQLERGPEHLAERARRALALYGPDTR